MDNKVPGGKKRKLKSAAADSTQKKKIRKERTTSENFKDEILRVNPVHLLIEIFPDIHPEILEENGKTINNSICSTNFD